MSTRSTIAMLQEDGSIKSIYCHFDGYPNGVGLRLKTHFMDPTKIEQLLSLGDLSVLGAEIGKKQNFEKPIRGYCLFYGRDRGETDCDARFHDDLATWLSDYAECAFAYLFANSEWIAFENHTEVQYLDEASKTGFIGFTRSWRNDKGMEIDDI